MSPYLARPVRTEAEVAADHARRDAELPGWRALRWLPRLRVKEEPSAFHRCLALHMHGARPKSALDG